MSLEAAVIPFVPWFPVNKEQEAALRAAGHHLPGGSSIQGPWNPAEKVQMLSSVWRMLGRNGVRERVRRREPRTKPCVDCPKPREL